jgi:hypothetical protein
MLVPIRAHLNGEYCGESKMEDAAQQDAQPACGKLEVGQRDDGALFAVPSTEAAAFRVPELWNV